MFKKLSVATAILMGSLSLNAFAAGATQVAAKGEGSSLPEVINLDSGIQITIFNKGNGGKPNEESNVEVHYKGSFDEAGTKVFDSSYSRGQTITFNLNQVIPCWTLGLQQLTVGSKAKLFCPSNTAYGPRGAGSAIPPNTDLYFTVELFGIKGTSK